MATSVEQVRDFVLQIEKTLAARRLYNPSSQPYREANEKVVEKCRAAGNEKVLLCERGASFGYHDLVVDMRSFPILREFGCPVIYDVTHSLQLPGGGKETGGLKQYAPILARAAAATGCVDGFFLEVHDQPEKALSDRSTQLDVRGLAGLIRELLAIEKLVER